MAPDGVVFVNKIVLMTIPFFKEWFFNGTYTRFKTGTEHYNVDESIDTVKYILRSVYNVNAPKGGLSLDLVEYITLCGMWQIPINKSFIWNSALSVKETIDMSTFELLVIATDNIYYPILNKIISDRKQIPTPNILERCEFHKLRFNFKIFSAIMTILIANNMRNKIVELLKVLSNDGTWIKYLYKFTRLEHFTILNPILYDKMAELRAYINDIVIRVNGDMVYIAVRANVLYKYRTIHGTWIHKLTSSDTGFREIIGVILNDRSYHHVIYYDAYYKNIALNCELAKYQLIYLCFDKFSLFS